MDCIQQDLVKILKLCYPLFQELSLLGQGLGTLLTFVDLDDGFL